MMNVAVFSSSRLHPESLVVNGVSVGHTSCLVLSPGDGDISRVYVQWIGLLDDMGRLERAPARVSDWCDHSVSCDWCEASSEQVAAVRTTGGSYPCVFLALKVP